MFGTLLSMRGLSQAFLVPGIAAILLATLLFSVGDSSPVGAQDPDSVQEISDLDLDMIVSPQAISPGSAATVELKLTNSDDNPASPEVTVFIPDNANLELNRLAPGTIFSVQNNSVSWLPVVAGNGQFSELVLPLTINVADIRSPEQFVRAQLKNGFAVKTYTTSFWVGVLPEATISFDPPMAAVGEPVQLIGNLFGPGPSDQVWSLGDGRVVEAVNPTVVFPASGTYEISLQISNPLGQVSIDSVLTVVPQPTARIAIEDTSFGIGQPIEFSSQSGGQPPLTYLWSFGDGSSSKDPNPIHRYDAPGSYQVQLSVRNDHGIDEVQLILEVGAQPIADIVIDGNVSAGELFEGQAFTDSTVNQIHWDMGDGRTLEGDRVSHVFWSAGDYLVTMIASSPFGETAVSRWIHVEPGTLLMYLPLIRNALSASLSSPGLVPLDRGQVANDNASQLTDLSQLQLSSTMTAAEQLVAYVNEARRQNNLGPLRYVYELSIAAQAHVDDMAINGYTGHAGSDGTLPPHRIQRAGYPGGYGGEATAWGMQFPIEPVEFWLDSPTHRAIILHPAVTDIGVGYIQDYRSENLWYWVAEFASPNLPVVNLPPPANEEDPAVAHEPEIQLLGPPRDSEFVLSAGSNLIFTWSWPLPLSSGERLVVNLRSSGRSYQLGIIRESASDGQYQLTIPVDQVPVAQEEMEWLVRLEGTTAGTDMHESQTWPIRFLSPNQDTITLPATVESPLPQPTTTVPPQPGPDSAQTPLPVSTPVPTTVP